ncbi:BppU family phage baseplate upper protein [Collinsella aerofaciens]|uniref:BppU family phage baseplate upper protein n=1 Tax=Collinsella aerofaciens TaxID=74426 RepID=UPI00356152A9
MSNTRTLELDISKEGTGACVKVGQGDDGGTTIKALIYDNGAEFALSGATAWLVVLLPNKRNYYRGQCSVSGNAATITVDESKLCSVSGYTDEAYFTITKSGKTYSTERFAIEILRSALDGQQPAQNWDDAVQDLIDRGNQAVSSANSAASAANGAAEDATAAAQNALNIANSIASIEPPSDDEVQELREENATLATALVELQDGYIVLGETAYMPTNRRTALSSETVTVAQATVSGETAMLN